MAIVALVGEAVARSDRFRYSGARPGTDYAPIAAAPDAVESRDTTQPRLGLGAAIWATTSGGRPDGTGTSITHLVTDMRERASRQVSHSGSPICFAQQRASRALHDDGVCVGRKRVALIMRANDLVGRCRRWWVTTTVSDPDVVAVDLLKRSFRPGTELDRVYVGDITYIRTWEGWLYLATVIDLASRRVVG